MTVTSTVFVPGGAVTLIVLSLVTVKFADVLPKSTADATVNAEPLIVTGVPPAVDPDAGLTFVTAGTGGAV